MIKTLQYFCTAATDWVFRRRSPGLTLVRIGVWFLIAIIAGCAFSVSIPTPNGTFSFSYDSGSNSSSTFIALLVFGATISLLGLFLVIRDEKRQQRKKVISIELRGLRDTSGQPLYASIPSNIIGNRDQLLIDIRQGADGIIHSPEDALNRLCTLPSIIVTREAGFDRSDITYVAAGLAPVPFSFLMGVLLDDESQITLMDWDRSRETWRSLSDEDDQQRFSVNGLMNLKDVSEVVLSVSVSYKTDSEAIHMTFPELPVIDMKLSTLSVDVHWSEDKQIALTKQFFDTALTIAGSNVKKVHLILAAPNSLVIRFGRAYDKRNLPELIVYQYEKGQSIAYPWGLSMPIGGNHPSIFKLR